MTQTLIAIRNLNKTFRLGQGAVCALKDVNLDIFQGEYLSIMGPSGSGKSTLFNMIGALDRPTSGSVTVADVDLTRLSSRELAYFRGNHIGYVFQSYNLIPAFTALDNVAMPLIFSGRSYEEAARRAAEVLTRVGLEQRVTHRPDELSGGQQQRVAVARALANQPLLVLADEPTGSLDPDLALATLALIREVCLENEAALLLVSHDPAMLDHFATRHRFADLNRAAAAMTVAAPAAEVRP